MRYLLLCHSFPSLMTPIAAWLAGQPDSQTLVASAWIRGSMEMPGLKKILLKKPKNLPPAENYLDYWTNAVKIGRHALFSLQSIAASGFMPDIILTCTASGAALALPEAFPGAFIVNYLEAQMGDDPAEAAMKTRQQSLQILESALNFSFSRTALAALPPSLARLVFPISPGIDTAFFRDEGNFGARRDIIIFYVPDFDAMDTCLDMLAPIQKNLPGCKFILLAATLKIKNHFSRKLEEKLPGLAAMLECNPAMEIARRLYRAARLYISPAVDLRPEMLEAMACGLPVMCAAKDKYLKEGKNCLAFESCGQYVQDMLARPDNLAKIGARGAKDARKYFESGHVAACHMESVLKAWEDWKQGGKGKIMSVKSGRS